MVYGADKRAIHNKVIVTTMKDQLQKARDWLDLALPNIYKQHIAEKLDVTMLQKLVPHRLDKPVMTATSTAYANALKSRTSPPLNAMMNAPTNKKPPRIMKQHLVDISFDEKIFRPSSRKLHRQPQHL